MTDKGAVCLGVAIVVAAGLIYLAARTYNETAVADGATVSSTGAVDISLDMGRAPFGFDLSGIA